MTASPGRQNVPPGAPLIRHRYVTRHALVARACDRLGIGSSGDSSEEPQIVGLAGPSGAGKSTVASMVVVRADVRKYFYKGVLWLPVGQGAKDRLPDLMLRLADMVFETVLLKYCRPPRKTGVGIDHEDGAAYIREVVDESSRRFLVVADDVWEVEVLRELKRAGTWVLYTTRDVSLLPATPLLRVDQVLEEEAEMVLRRAADLRDSHPLPQAAYDLMRRCNYAVLDLAFVGSWSDVRGREDGKAWQMGLDRILEAQKGGEGGQPLSWRAAVLRAGSDELARHNVKNRQLYLALAVIPKGLAFPSKVAAMLMYDGDPLVEDLKAARGILATLERWSILTLEGDDTYRVHDEHTGFIQECFSTNQNTRNRVLPRWRRYISSVQALLKFSSFDLLEIWGVLGRVEGNIEDLQPYDEALDAMDPSSADRPAALETAAGFHRRREDWEEAYTKYSQLLEEKAVGEKSQDVARTLYNRGWCALKAGRADEAEKSYRRSLSIREEMLGCDHPVVASTLYKLGVCISETGGTEKAMGFYQRALAIREKTLGDDHPDVARTLHSLGMCWGKLGRTKEAERLLSRALTIREKFGVDHASLAETRKALVELCTSNSNAALSTVNVLLVGVLLFCVALFSRNALKGRP